MKPKIVGTGLSGLVGSRIVELLSERCDFSDLSLDTGIDITQPSQVEKIIRKSPGQVVLHLAAFTNVDQAWQQQGDKNGSCYQVNVIGTRNIAQICAQYKKYLIHFSTDYVFDGQKDEPFTEEDQPNPIEWYGQTKYWAEQEVEKSGAKYFLARIAFPFRAKFRPKKDIIREISQKIKEGTLPPMFVDQQITPTFIDDLAHALKIVIQKKPVGTYHLVGSTILTPYELACQIAEIFNFDKKKIKKGSLEEYLKNNPRPRGFNMGLANQKAKKELGIKMKTARQALQLIKDQRQKS